MPELRRLVGVYDADGSLRGEVTYVVGHLLGRLHCGLCDITHGPLRRKASFDRWRDAVPVPVELKHRDERTLAEREASPDLPVVLADTDAGLVVVLGPADLEAARGDVGRFSALLDEALAHHDLRPPRGAVSRPASPGWSASG